MPPKKRRQKNNKSDKINPLALIIVGTRGTRKSSLAGEIIGKKQSFVFSNNYHGYVDSVTNASENITPDSIKAAIGVTQITPTSDIQRNESVVSMVASISTNVIIFIDDIRDWIAGKGRVKYGIIALFGQSRPRNLDIIIACHSFAQIPGDLMDYAPVFCIKKTTRKPSKSFVDEFEDQQKLLEIVNRVNERSKKIKWYGEIYRPF